jgi:pimeloyl-ACP methyl ester carboxylesterase
MHVGVRYSQPTRRVYLVRGAKTLALLALTGVLVAVTTAWWMGGQLYASANHPVGPPPADLPAQPVAFPSASGAVLEGWLVPSFGQHAGVVLMHGSGGDRRSMISRARFLTAAGYPVLLFDFQATGESLGQHTTDGYLEARDAQAAVAFMRAAGGVKKVGIIGFSLGGAATLLGDHPLAAEAVVLEAVYTTIEEATAARIELRLGPHSGWLYRLFTWQLGPRLGIHPEQLRPIEKIGAIQAPVFLIAGAKDPHPTLAESQRLFAAAPAPKQFWAVAGAAHENFHDHNPQDYEARVLDFFTRTLLVEPTGAQEP